jgi:pimeloyl-ACP methyl ester carboxylesterase
MAFRLAPQNPSRSPSVHQASFMRSMTSRFLILMTLAAVTAAMSTSCAERRQPDMTHAMALADMGGTRPPLILIPGFMGSRLRDPHTHKIAWGTMANVLMGGDTDDLALSIDPSPDGVPGESLVPYQIYGSLWGVDYYRAVLRSLKEAGGYQIGDIDHPRPGDNAFVFIYDWRRDNVETARRLADTIENLKRARGNPSERFDLVAHSQGGLIARYYIKYGADDVLASGPPFVPTMAGAPNVNKVILIGTPNQGCLESLRILHLGVKKGFRPMRPEVVFTMPSVFQMLPLPGLAVFVDTRGAPLPLDLYDTATWEREQWSVFAPETQKRIARRLAADEAGMARHNGVLRRFLEERLDNARRFHEAIDAPEIGGARVEYHAFGSDCRSTRKVAIVRRRPGAPELLFDDERIPGQGIRERLAGVLYGPGDGVVLMQSLLGISSSAQPEPVEFSSAFFVCGQHGVLPNNTVFQNNLLYLLLMKGTEGHSAGGRTRASVP